MRTYSKLFFATLSSGIFASCLLLGAGPGFAEPTHTEAESAQPVATAPAHHPIPVATLETQIRSAKPETALAATSGSAPYRSLIAQHAAANGVPFALADAVVKVESRYNPNARNGPSLGLAQINLRTARGLGYSGNAGGLLNANTNLTYAMRYLGQAYRLAGGDTCGTVMRYQNGTASTHFSGANRAYCSKVKSHFSALGIRKRTT